MPDDARMTMNMKKLRVLVAGLVGASAALAVAGGGGQPGSAASCQRSVAIDPQATVSESARTLTFVVYTNSCAAAGSVSYTVTDGTAQRPADFMLESGRLSWAAGDLSSRRITATIAADQLREAPLEEFKVMLVDPTEEVRIASPNGQARIFDDDSPGRSALVDDRICLISGESSCLPQSSGGGTEPFSNPKGGYTIEPGHVIIAPIVLNTANSVDVTVLFQTSDGGLVGGLDYVPVSQYVVIPAGTTVAHVEIQLLPHAYTQPGHYFNTHVTSYTAGIVVDGNGLVTVVA